MNTASRKLAAEFVGTFLLVFLAVGAAVFGIGAKVGVDGAGPGNGVVGVALAFGLVLLAIGYLLSKYLLRWIFEQIAKTPEMVVAMSISWCAFMAGMGSWIGLSMEMGALIAGVAISTFPYSVHVTAKVLPLRDFFLTLFFLSIGMKIPVPDAALLIMAVVIVLFVIVSRFLTIYPLLTLAGILIADLAYALADPRIRLEAKI